MRGKITGVIAGIVMLASAGSAAPATTELVRTWPRPLPGHPHRADRFYPAVAPFCQEAGTVRLDLTIDERGQVIGSRVADTSGHHDLDLAAQHAVRTWQYVPATLGGKPIKAHWLIQIVFRLDEPRSLNDTAISWGCQLVEYLTGR